MWEEIMCVLNYRKNIATALAPNGHLLYSFCEIVSPNERGCIYNGTETHHSDGSHCERVGIHMFYKLELSVCVCVCVCGVC